MLMILTHASQINLQLATKRIIEKFKNEISSPNIFIKVSFQLVCSKETSIAQGK